MAWVKLDDAFAEHPKILALSDAAFRLWINGLAYSNRRLTDGLVPRKMLLRLTPEECADPSALVVELVTEQMPGCAALWEEVEEGWRIHDYHEYQPPSDLVIQRRTKAKERMKLNRLIKGLEADLRAGEDVQAELDQARAAREALRKPVRANDIPAVRANKSANGSANKDVRANKPANVRKMFAHPVPVPVPVSGDAAVGRAREAFLASIRRAWLDVVNRSLATTDPARVDRWQSDGVDLDRAVFVIEWLGARATIAGETINSLGYFEPALKPGADPQPVPNEDTAGLLASTRENARKHLSGDLYEACVLILEKRQTPAVLWGIWEGIQMLERRGELKGELE